MFCHCKTEFFFIFNWHKADGFVIILMILYIQKNSQEKAYIKTSISCKLNYINVKKNVVIIYKFINLIFNHYEDKKSKLCFVNFYFLYIKCLNYIWFFSVEYECLKHWKLAL